MSNNLTVQQFREIMPKNHRGNINQALMDKINKVLADPAMGETLRDNLISYTHIMRDGKFKMESYIDAVKYVSYKLMGCTNFESYIKTFPDRYQTFIQNGVSTKDIHSYVSAYNKNKLVNLIYEQTLIPTHVLNADIFQKAINVQADLMLNAKSEKVKCDAANSLLNHLKRPEVSKIELAVTTSEGGAIAELREITAQLAAQQRERIIDGTMSAQDVAHQSIHVTHQEEAEDAEFSDDEENS